MGGWSAAGWAGYVRPAAAGVVGDSVQLGLQAAVYRGDVDVHLQKKARPERGSNSCQNAIPAFVSLLGICMLPPSKANPVFTWLWLRRPLGFMAIPQSAFACPAGTCYHMHERQMPTRTAVAKMASTTVPCMHIGCVTRRVSGHLTQLFMHMGCMDQLLTCKAHLCG